MTEPRPTCTRTEQAVGWALHALEPDEEIAVERHVPTCADCSLPPSATPGRDDPARHGRRTGRAAHAAARLDSRRRGGDPAGPAAVRDAAAAYAPQAAHTASDGSGGSGPRRPAPDESAARRAEQAAVTRSCGRGGGRGRWRSSPSVASGSAPSNCSSRRSSCSSSSTPRRRRCPVRPRSCRTSPGPATPTPCWPARTARRSRRSSSRAASAPSTRSASPPTPPTRPTCCGASRTPRPPPAARGVRRGSNTASPQTVGPPGAQPFGAYAISLEPGRTPPAVPTDVVASGALTA